MSGFSYPRGQAPGTLTNDDAVAGNVGEVIAASLAVGSAVSLTTNTAASIISITLTPGDWDVDAWGAFVPALTTSVTQGIISISETNNTLDVTTDFAFHQDSSAAQVPGGLQSTKTTGPVRKKVASGTLVVYLVMRSIFTVSTMTAFGGIRARRVR